MPVLTVANPHGSIVIGHGDEVVYIYGLADGSQTNSDMFRPLSTENKKNPSIP